MKERKRLKQAAWYSVLLMVATIFLSVTAKKQEETLFITQMISPFPITSFTDAVSSEGGANNTNSEFFKIRQSAGKSGLLEMLGEKTIVIQKSESDSESVNFLLLESPVDRQITIRLEGCSISDFDTNRVSRLVADCYFTGMPPIPSPTIAPTITESFEQINEITPSSSDINIYEKPVTDILGKPFDPLEDPVKSIELSMEQSEDGFYTTALVLKLNRTYCYRVYEDSNYYYIALLEASEVYNRIVVLDAGHGGKDPGTYSKGSVYLEKDINLNILLYLEEFLEQEDIKLYLTRTTDRRLTLDQRVELANDVEADFFLSIHCNANENRSVHGTEVLYNEFQDQWPGINSKDFSQICLEEVNKRFTLQNNGLVPRGTNVSIIKYSKVPVALVETAYMSNESDMNALAKAENQKKIAEGLYYAILRAYEVKDAENREISQP